MSTYAVGDIQGCFQTFQALLEEIEFDPKRDRLWLTGDLVNRGPQSLETLRWVKANQQCITTVLGNHDLHFIGRFFGFRSEKSKDTLDKALAAHDAPELVEWLLHQPVLYVESSKLLVHGGLLPLWTEGEALKYANEAQYYLTAGPGQLKELYQHLNDKELQWSKDLDGVQRAAATIKVLTLIRVCHKNRQEIDFSFTDEPHKTPTDYAPWFHWPHHRSRETKVFFGHWSSLGFYKCENVFALDTGCVWHRQLTALRLEDEKAFSVPYRHQV